MPLDKLHVSNDVSFGLGAMFVLIAAKYQFHVRDIAWWAPYAAGLAYFGTSLLSDIVLSKL